MRTSSLTPPQRGSERGSAVVIMMVVLAIIVLVVAGNVAALTHLDREIKRVDKLESQRLAATSQQK